MSKRYVSKKFIHDLIKTPETAATLSKMVDVEEKPVEGEKKEDKFQSPYKNKELTTEWFHQPKNFATNYQSSLDALKLFPDLRLAAEIYVSLVTASGNLGTPSLIFGSNNPVILPDVKAKLLRIVETEIRNNYKLTDQLDEELLEMLIGKGSVVRVTVPENSLDDFIHGRNPYDQNVAAESLGTEFKNGDLLPLGIIGGSGTSLEGYGAKEQVKSTHTLEDMNISITDNFNALKIPELAKAERRSSLENILYEGVTVNRVKDSSDDGMGLLPEDKTAVIRRGDIFARVKETDKEVEELRPENVASRASIARPLSFKIPSESILPITVPGQPDKAKGYAVMLDSNYNFLTLETKKCSKEQDTENKLASSKEDTSLKSNMAAMLGTKSKDKQSQTGLQAFQRFKDVLEKDLSEKLNRGLYTGEAFEIGENQDIQYLMFLRALSGKKSRILFLPAEMVTYYALEYDDLGVGKNVLSDMKELNNMRGTLLFSDVLASVRNNLRTTNVQIDLDPKDPNVSKTIKTAVGEVMKTRAVDLPLNMSSLSQLSEWVQRAGYTFSFNNHPGLPEVKFEFEDITNDRPTGNNDELVENIRDLQYNAFGLTPEVVDTGLDINFATTDSANRKYLLKRIRKTRNKLSVLYSKEIKHLMKCDPNIRERLLSEVEGYDMEDARTGEKLKPEEIIKIFTASLVVSLPDNEEDTEFEARKAKYEDYKNGLADALEAWLDPELYDEDVFGRDIGDVLKVLGVQIKGHYLRQFQTENGYFAELGEMTTIDSTGSSFLKMGDIIPEHVKGILTTLEDFYKGVKKDTRDTQKMVNKIREYMEDHDSDGEDDESSTDQNTDDDDQDGGLDDTDNDVDSGDDGSDDDDLAMKQPDEDGGSDTDGSDADDDLAMKQPDED